MFGLTKESKLAKANETISRLSDKCSYLSKRNSDLYDYIKSLKEQLAKSALSNQQELSRLEQENNGLKLALDEVRSAIKNQRFEDSLKRTRDLILDRLEKEIQGSDKEKCVSEKTACADDAKIKDMFTELILTPIESLIKNIESLVYQLKK